MRVFSTFCAKDRVSVQVLVVACAVERTEGFRTSRQGSGDVVHAHLRGDELGQ